MNNSAHIHSRFDNNIDFLRLLAAIGVVFGHAFAFAGGVDPITRAISSLDLPHMDAVQDICVWFLFFISGYLVSASYASRHDIKNFLWARFLRIYPGLFLVILITTLCGVFITSLTAEAYFTDELTWKYFSRNILGFSIKYDLPGVFTDNPYTAMNGSLWTIPLELRLYLVVGLLGLCGLFKRKLALAGILVLLVLGQLFIQEFAKNAGGLLTAVPVPMFLTGALFFTFREKIPKYWLGLLLLIVVWYSCRYIPVAGHALLVLAFCYAFHLIAYASKLRILDVGRFGDYSYGVYLWSAPIQQTLVWSGIKNGWFVFFISLVLSLFAGVLSWHWVEKRAIAFKKKPKM